MINSQHYLLYHHLFRNVKINCYKLVGGRRNSQNYMLAFHWEIIQSILNNLQGILQTIILAPLLFF